ncbi:MAG: azurin [Bacteroidota bacterium]
MKNLFLLFFVAIWMISCGGDSGATTESTATAESEATSAPAETSTISDAAEVELELLSDDQMQYNVKELKVRAGQKVTLTLKHTGQMDKQVMGHNFVLLKAGTDIAEFATAAMTEFENEYIPADESAIIAYTGLVGGGESTSITFDAPEAGTYDYICSFPGHYGFMQGKFIVE